MDAQKLQSRMKKLISKNATLIQEVNRLSALRMQDSSKLHDLVSRIQELSASLQKGYFSLTQISQFYQFGERHIRVGLSKEYECCYDSNSSGTNIGSKLDKE